MKYFWRPNKSAAIRFLVALPLLLGPVAGKSQPDPFLAGMACMQQGSYDSAVVHFRSALEANTGETEFLFQLGRALFAAGELPEAREAFFEVEKRKPGLGSFFLARVETRLNRPEQALKYLRIHLNSRYRVPEERILLERDLAPLESHEGWQALWNEKEWYGFREKRFQEARFLKEHGQELEAINILNRLEEENYRRSEVQQMKGTIYAALGNRKAALSSFRAAARSDVRNVDALHGLALCQLEDGSFTDAAANLDRVIRREPYRFEAYLLRARAYSRMGDLASAEKDLHTYLTYFPDDDEAFYQKGRMEFDHGKYLDALGSFNRALSLDRGNAEYWHARGRTYASTGLDRYAEKDMSMALDLDPYDGEVWFEKGKVSENLGRPEDACHCYRKAFQYGVHEAREGIDATCR